jgi:large subunit ribosomal protein L10
VLLASARFLFLAMVTKEQKAKQIEDLAKGFEESGAVVFTDYSGLSVGEISDLRKKLAGMAAEFAVVKNTLIRLASEKTKFPAVNLSGPTAVLLSRGGDPIKCIKAIVSLIKEKGKGEVKVGIFEGVLKDAAEISELALIPSKAVLHGRLVGLLNAPVSRFVNVMYGGQRGLVSVLGQIVTAKGGAPQNAVAKSKGGEE